MIITWTPELLQAALETLTEDQRKALQLYASVGVKIGTKRLKAAGLTKETYTTALQEALTRARDYFKFLGITRVSDLNFQGERDIDEGKFLRPTITRINHEA